ncbi:hypothetical protein BSKO_03253 [Bryopsis sp. KO-2023]|nr:hypothetical protein BSKO_03253 [Bryopsis sp. KO-2023]
MIWTKLAKFCTWGYVMACVFKSDNSGANAQGDEGLLSNHAYSIIACRELDDGTRLIKLHSCWGCGGWNGAWGRGSDEWSNPDYAAFKQEVECVSMQDEGLFWIPYEDFIESFNRIYVNRLFPPFWHQLTLHCGWHGTAAGGPYMIDGNLSSTWACNPQFRITSRKAGEILLCLQQKDPQISHGTYVAKGEREFSYGLVLFRTSSGRHGRLWELEDSDLMHDTGLTAAKEVAITIRITPKQPLLAIPYTSRQGQEGPFVLRSFSSLPVEVEQLAAPLSLVVSGHWNGCSAGGQRRHPTWASNPQYMLNVEHKTTVVISLSRPDIRHSIIPPKFKPDEVLSLVVTTPELSDEGLGPRLGIRSAEDVIAEKDTDGMAECVLRLELEPETPYVLVPSLSMPSKEAPFELRILSGIPLELTPLPQKKTVTLNGSWTREMSGGCNLNPGWNKNPMFTLTTTTKGSYRISLLLCKGRWKRNQSLDRMIGFYILSSGGKAGEAVERAKTTILAETPFIPENTMACQYELHSDATYVVMPTTYSPNQLGEFSLSVSSTEDFTLTEVVKLKQQSMKRE